MTESSKPFAKKHEQLMNRWVRRCGLQSEQLPKDLVGLITEFSNLFSQWSKDSNRILSNYNRTCQLKGDTLRATGMLKIQFKGETKIRFLCDKAMASNSGMYLGICAWKTRIEPTSHSFHLYAWGQDKRWMFRCVGRSNSRLIEDDYICGRHYNCGGKSQDKQTYKQKLTHF